MSYQENKYLYDGKEEKSWDDRLVLKKEVRVARQGPLWYLCDADWEKLSDKGFFIIKVEEGSIIKLNEDGKETESLEDYKVKKNF